MISLSPSTGIFIFPVAGSLRLADLDQENRMPVIVFVGFGVSSSPMYINLTRLWTLQKATLCEEGTCQSS